MGVPWPVTRLDLRAITLESPSLNLDGTNAQDDPVRPAGWPETMTLAHQTPSQAVP